MREQQNELVCRGCKAGFTLSKEEKSVYEAYGFEYAPQRCPACRGTSAALEAAVKPKREMYEAICEACGKSTQLPFKPKGDKPVYCLECFKSKRN